uniref:PLD phosphodiesterase domain-containing protein n=1 Tax=Arcella intermedia TaxID=1963864 RepID=A0A6B2L671_9EUKA
MINSSMRSVKIAGMYLTLTGGSIYPPSAEGIRGINIFNALISAQQRGVYVQIVMHAPQQETDTADLVKLASYGIDIRYVNWAQLNNGNGILHTKLMVTDSSSLYVGSANWDWRSIAQVKELGVIVTEPALVQDAEKVFDIYWLVSNSSVLPPSYPASLDTQFNEANPANLLIDGIPSKVFFSASPIPFNTPSRMNDIDALIWHIDSAEKFVYGSVMDYAPYTLYMKPPKGYYWGLLDDAFRRAAFRGVTVHLLFSEWPYTPAAVYPYFHSLAQLDNISIQTIKLPPYSGGDIPYARVCHSKYLVTEKSFYITTSNWTPDYFQFTGGVSINLWENEPQRKIVETVFTRDWTSQYTTPIAK